MSENRLQRQTLYNILKELQLDLLSKGQQDELMVAVGFEEDVTFAKSLFSDRIIQINKEYDGQFEKYLIKDEVVKISLEGRRFLMAIFRRYHQQRLKGKTDGGLDIAGLKLPDSKNIEEVIAFQKRMYSLFRHLIPQTNIPLLSPPSPQPKFNPFPIFAAERPLEFPPFLPFTHRPSIDSLRRNDSHLQRHSFFSKNSFAESGFGSNLQQQQRGMKGFTCFGEEGEFSLHPSKKLKRDSNINFSPQNVQAMRKELEFARTGKANNKPLWLDRSISLQEDEGHPIRRGGDSQYQKEKGEQ